MIAMQAIVVSKRMSRIRVIVRSVVEDVSNVTDPNPFVKEKMLFWRTVFDRHRQLGALRALNSK
jgi:hypothetical protein